MVGRLAAGEDEQVVRERPVKCFETRLDAFAMLLEQHGRFRVECDSSNLVGPCVLLFAAYPVSAAASAPRSPSRAQQFDSHSILLWVAEARDRRRRAMAKSLKSVVTTSVSTGG